MVFDLQGIFLPAGIPAVQADARDSWRANNRVRLCELQRLSSEAKRKTIQHAAEMLHKEAQVGVRE